MITFKEKSLRNKERLSGVITKVLEDLFPQIKILEQEILELRKMKYDTLKRQVYYLVILQRIVDEFKDKYKSKIIDTIQIQYKKQLNKVVEGAVEERGKSKQKKSFKKSSVLKELDSDFIDKSIDKIIDSIVAVELAYAKKKLAMVLLFKEM